MATVWREKKHQQQLNSVVSSRSPLMALPLHFPNDCTIGREARSSQHWFSSWVRVCMCVCACVVKCEGSSLPNGMCCIQGGSGKQQCNQREEQKENKDPSLSEYGTNTFDAHTHTLTHMPPRSPFRLIWRGAKFLLDTSLLPCLVGLRFVFEGCVLMSDQTMQWSSTSCFKL